MEEYLKQIEAKADKAQETVMTVLTKVLPSVLERLNKLEDFTEELQKIDNAILEHMNDQFNELESHTCACKQQTKSNIAVTEISIEEVSEEAQKSTKRQQTNYGTYVQIKSLSDDGVTDKDIASQLGIPYTTVRAYMRWTDEQIAKKKKEWDKKTAGKRHVINSPVKTFVSKELDNTEIKQIEDTQETQELEVPETPEVATAITWFTWSDLEREQASKHVNYWPEDGDTIVIVVRDGNAYSMPYAVREISWGVDSNITHWRYAAEDEKKQYEERRIAEKVEAMR